MTFERETGNESVANGESMIPVSVVVLAKNEENNLERSLSVLKFTDDVVVVDDFSSDGTAGVAEKHGARVLKHAFESFAQQRNWGQSKDHVRYDWVLHLDADEVVTPQLASAIADTLRNGDVKADGFFLCFKTMLMGKWLRRSAQFPVWVLRLVRKDRVRFVARGHGEAHECDGPVGYIREPFLHYTFSKGLGEWFEKHNRYSTVEAEDWMRTGAGRKVRWRNVLSSDPVLRRRELKRLSFRLPLRPMAKFVYSYCIRLGFLDGRQGLTYCALLSIYEYMICLKLRERKKGGS